MKVEDIKPGMILAGYWRDTTVVLRVCSRDDRGVVDAYVLESGSWERRHLFGRNSGNMIEITPDFLTKKEFRRLPREAKKLVMARREERARVKK